MKHVLLLALIAVGCGRYHTKHKGDPGTSCTTRQDSVGVFVECTDGTDSFIPFPKDGETGATGPQGETVVGPVGEAGSSCSVSNSGLVTCTDGSSYQIENGIDGVPGTPGQSCLLEQRNVSCVSHTKRYKSFLVCPNGELYLKDVTVRSGC
jgi:hypothetical protein